MTFDTKANLRKESNLSRRRVIAGAAWAAPAIALSTAAPAMAASTPTNYILWLFPSENKMLTNSQVTMQVLITGGGNNPEGTRVRVTVPEGFTHTNGGGQVQTYTVQRSGLAAFTVSSGPNPSSGTGVAMLELDTAVTATATFISTVKSPHVPCTVTILGVVERSTNGPDEFRCDFQMVTKKGVRPKKVEYNFLPYKPDHWYTLKQVDDARASTSQAWSIVMVQDLGDGLEMLWCTARGDSDVRSVKSSVFFTNGIRVNWPDGSSTVGQYVLEDVPRSNENGRPVAVQAWDLTTKHLPNYIGPNAQTGWGNYVPAGSSQKIDGRNFHIDAINSGRSSKLGNDQTTSIYYQFVRGDNGKPASITPTPRLAAITNHSSGVKGKILAELGFFELDDPGYYRLVVWPQSSSSKPTAPQSSVGVAYDPNDLSQGTTIGSVFWKIPRTA